MLEQLDMCNLKKTQTLAYIQKLFEVEHRPTCRN